MPLTSLSSVLPPSHYEPFGSLKRGIEGGLAALTSSKVEKVEEVSNYSSDNTSNGTLADSDQLAALRDQLLGK